MTSTLLIFTLGVIAGVLLVLAGAVVAAVLRDRRDTADLEALDHEVWDGDWPSVIPTSELQRRQEGRE
jgi:hypothetical protein